MIDNKTIVLTGASSGIGLEVLRILAKGRDNRILAVARHVDNLRGFAPNVTPLSCDISTQAGVDRVFQTAEDLFGKIDLFYANAGFPYYEEFNYTDWDRIDAMFRTNTVSPIYTYAKYINHLNGRPGILAYTVSAIGEMAMPGYAIYSSSKFALNGFQQAIRLEKPDNLQITCLYPVATDTNFFKVANELEFEKPFPVQSPKTVARKMVKGIEEGKDKVSPCGLFGFSKVLMGVLPPVKKVYWNLETQKLERFKVKVAEHREKLRADAMRAAEELRQRDQAARKELALRGEKLREDARRAAEELKERELAARKELDERTAKLREEIKDKLHEL